MLYTTKQVLLKYHSYDFVIVELNVGMEIEDLRRSKSISTKLYSAEMNAPVLFFEIRSESGGKLN